MTDKEFEEMWARIKARDKRIEEEWNALSEEEKKRRQEKYNDSFFERISDDITGNHDEEDSPKEVINAACGRIEVGGVLRKMNRRGYKDVYMCVFPDDNQATIGVPEVYLWDGAKVETIVGEQALDLI